MTKGLSYFTLITCLVISLTATSEQPTLATEKQINTAKELISQAQKSSLAFDIVESLSTEIGPRLGGSENEARAREWAKKLGKELGFDRVTIEPFDMPFWDRGDLSIVMTSPYKQDLYGTALGGAAPSDGDLNAPIAYFRSYHDITKVEKDQIKGKIAFIDGDLMVKSQTGAGYGPANQKRRAGWRHAMRGGAIALVVRSVGSDSHRFPHTGMMSAHRGIWSKIPVIAVSNPDADHIRRIHDLGKNIELSVSSASEWKGMVQSGNVVLDLIGSEKPDEIVLIGGHLDSWDLGTGALDDGAGVAITTAAAALIAKLPKRPKRTVRVVLFGAEEVGLLGAFAYAKAHQSELHNHVLATESDFGARTVWQFASNVNTDADAFVDQMARVLAPLGIAQGSKREGGGGPDVIPLDNQGVPTVRLKQNGMDYFDYHHTPDDTLDKIDPRELAQNVAAYAAVAYLAADVDIELRREKKK